MRALLSRLRANIREAVLSLRTGDYWVTLFLAGGSMAWGALLLWPGGTLGAYHVYLWMADVPDPALGAPMLALGVWAALARGRARRFAALAHCFAWGALAVAIALGNYQHTLETTAGPSGALVHYTGWAILAFLAAFRAASPEPARHD